MKTASIQLLLTSLFHFLLKLSNRLNVISNFEIHIYLTSTEKRAVQPWALKELCEKGSDPAKYFVQLSILFEMIYKRIVKRGFPSMNNFYFYSNFGKIQK